MASLQLNTLEVLKAIGQVAGINRTPTEWSDQLKDDARQAIRSGLRRFFNPENHTWLFLEREFYATLPAPYSNGTVAVANGVVTLTGSSWPAWAADAILSVDGHKMYVTEVTDPTHLAVNNTGVSVSPGATYTLYQWRFPLPENFAEFVGGVLYTAGGCVEHPRNSVDTAIRLLIAGNFQTGAPKQYAVVAGGDNESDDDAWYFTYWPVGSESGNFSARFKINPEDNLDAADITTDADTTIQADSVHAETIMAAILAAAEEIFNEQSDGVWAKRFEERLAASVKRDKHSQGPVVHEFPNGTKADRDYYLRYHTPTYHDLL